ncbi:MAG: hydroxysqualene dehydroxylase HpnE [Phycisphaerales bacterium]
MGCCTNYFDLCRRLGVIQHMRWTNHTTWVEAGGRTSVMSPWSLPTPAHLAPGLMGAKFLSFADKAAISSAMAALLREDRRACRGITFAQWLSRHDQPQSARRKFWEPVIVSACNLALERVCAATAIHVFQEGFLANRDASAIAVSGVPLVALYDGAANVIAGGAGGAVRLGTSVERVWADRVRLSSGEVIGADRVVLATTFERARRLIDEETRATDDRFAALDAITHSPILGVHMVFDRPVLPHPHAVLVDRPTQWVFRKDDNGCKIHAVISGADEWMDLDEAQITRRVLDDIQACFPDADGGASLLASRPVKEKLATFAPTIEMESRRVAVQGPSGIVLAGDYVDTGWPATMEGAVRAGIMAAAAVLGVKASDMLSPPLPMGAIPALLHAG